MVTLSKHRLLQLAAGIFGMLQTESMRQHFSRDQNIHEYCHNSVLWRSLDGHTLSLRLRAAALQADLFEYLCLEGQEHRRNVELNALQPMVGSDPLTHPQLTRMQEARQQHHDQAAAAQREADMLRQVFGICACTLCIRSLTL